MIKKVLYFTGHDISKPDGLGTNELEFTVLLAERLGKNSWTVLPECESEMPHLKQLNAITFSTAPLRSPLAHWRDSVQTAKTIADLVRENDIDIVVTRLTAFPLIPWLLQRRHGIPVALKTLGRVWPKEGSAPPIAAAYNHVCHWLTKGVVRSATAMDTSLPKVQQAALSIAPGFEHIELIRNAANVAMFKPTSKAPLGWHESKLDLSGKGPVLGFGGSFPSLRGAKELIQALPDIVPHYPDVQVVVAGWDDDMDKVVAIAKHLDVGDRCHFLGWVPYGRMPEVINLMDIGFSFFEIVNIKKAGNASQKVRQYLACGKPVISIEDGHQFLEDNDLGSLVDHMNIPSVAQATLRWLKRLDEEGPAITNRLRNYAVEHLSTSKAFDLRMDLWSRALSKQQGKD